jgi:hypothetical protein
MEEYPTVFGFALSGVETIRCDFSEEFYDPGTPYRVKASVSTAALPDNEIRCFAQIALAFEEYYFVDLLVACSFYIDEDAWQWMLIPDDRGVVVPREFAQRLAMITIGTARGVLHSKISETPLSEVILPLIDVAPLVSEDVVALFER